VQPIRNERPSQVVIKAFCSVRKEPVYLVQYDKFAQQYQLIGGRPEGPETPLQTMQRELREELPLNALRPDLDYQLQVVAEDLTVAQLSRTFGAFTQYRFWIFTAEFERPLVLGEKDRWVTEEELFVGRLDDGSRMPWNDHLARVANALPRGLGSLPFSFSKPVRSRVRQEV
jgi:8-oxo-dGTP pyrophosphatase MutT (NUDIX family)